MVYGAGVDRYFYIKKIQSNKDIDRHEWRYEILKKEGKTTVVNIRREHEIFEVYIGRKNNRYNLPESPFCNPFPLSDFKGDRKACLDEFTNYFIRKIGTDLSFCLAVEELRGKILGCWCSPEPCHGDVIVKYLEGGLEKLKRVHAGKKRKTLVDFLKND